MSTAIAFAELTVQLHREVEIRVLEAFPEGTSKICWKIEYEEPGMGLCTAVLKFLKEPPEIGRPWRDLEEEVTRIRNLRNSGVEGLEDIIISGTCRVVSAKSSYDTTFVICRYVPFTEPLWRFLEKPSLPRYGLPFLLTLMARLLPVIKACHRHGCVHLDLHPNNILVKGGTDQSTQQVVCEQVVILDFATALDVFERRYGTESDFNNGTVRSDAIAVDGYRGFLHPFLRRHLDSNRSVPIEALRSEAAKRFDLFAIARCLEEVLGKATVQEDEDITKKSIQFVLRQLRNESERITYDIDKALSTVELNRAYLKRPILIRLAAETNTVIPQRFAQLIDNLEFQRLRRVYQLGFTHLVYPSATHSRFSHSIGVFHLCNHYIKALQENSEVFRGMYVEKDLEVLRVAALVHDIGHYPFAHYFEELWDKEQEYAGDTPLRVNHERMGLDIIFDKPMTEGPLEGARAILGGIEKALGPDGVPALINFFDKENDRFDILRDILSGPIDCDKVDYLKRDGHACGVPYPGAIDIQRLLASLTVCYDEQASPNKHVLAVTSKGLAPVESILNARYHMFSEVYWHKVCRGIAAMIKHALFRLIDTGLSQEAFCDAVFSGTDWHVLRWLSDSLRKAKLGDVADDLIEYPLLQCNRGALYQRIITFSAIWDSRTGSPAWTNLLELGNRRDYALLNAMKEKIRDALNDELASTFRARNIPNIKEHQLLIDIPPAEESKQQIPRIFYPETKNRDHVLPLNDVSGIHTAQIRKDKSPLELTHRIRLFSARRHAKVIRDKWPTTEDLGKVLSSIIRRR